MVWGRSVNSLGQYLSVKHGRFKDQVWRNRDDAAAVLRMHRRLDFLLPHHLPPPTPGSKDLDHPIPPPAQLWLNE